MQLIDCPAIEGKRWEWHFVLFKDWLRLVEGGLSNRKYVKWLRGRKIFDRSFIRFVELLLGVSAPGKQAPALNEVGEELVEELGNSERARAEAMSSQGDEPGRDEPSFPPRPGIRRRRGDDELEAANPTAHKPPTADDDPFLRALLERFGELNGYLAMFTLRQLGEDFLGTSELYRRIGSNDFEAKRPSMKEFEGWLRWLEWLGGIKKVGFRFKATKAGLELSQFLGEMPLEELLDMGGEEADEEAEAAASEGEAEAAEGAADDAGAGAGDGAEGEEEDEEAGDGFDASFDDDDEFEGLDLPPEAEVDPDAKPYWQQDEAKQAPPPSLADLTADLKRMTESEEASPSSTAEEASPTAESPSPKAETPSPKAEKPSPKAETPSPSPKAETPSPKAETPSPKVEAPKPTAATTEAQPTPRPPLSPLPPLPAATAAPSNRALLQSAARWWLQSEAPERATSGISLAEHPSGRPLGLFKLLALATLLEAEVPPAHARALFDALEQRRVLEQMLLEGAPLESALEVAWELAVSPRLEERLVHLARYRARLRDLPSTTLKVPDVHALARRIRAAISGETLHAGLLLVVRELAAAGVGPRAGLEQVEWLPTLLDTAECPA